MVEVIAKKSQNISWVVSLDGQRQTHKFIRRVSIDEFYKIVAGEDDAFFQMCMALPTVISEVLNNATTFNIPKDTVFSELQAESTRSFELALYIITFC